MSQILKGISAALLVVASLCNIAQAQQAKVGSLAKTSKHRYLFENGKCLDLDNHKTQVSSSLCVLNSTENGSTQRSRYHYEVDARTSGKFYFSDGNCYDVSTSQQVSPIFCSPMARMKDACEESNTLSTINGLYLRSSDKSEIAECQKYYGQNGLAFQNWNLQNKSLICVNKLALDCTSPCAREYGLGWTVSETKQNVKICTTMF